MKLLMAILGLFALSEAVVTRDQGGDRAARAREATRRRRRQLAELELEEELAQQDIQAEQEAEQLAYEREQARWEAERQRRITDRQRRLEQPAYGYDRGYDQRGVDRGYDRGYERAPERAPERGYERAPDRGYDRGYDRYANEQYRTEPVQAQRAVGGAPRREAAVGEVPTRPRFAEEEALL